MNRKLNSLETVALVCMVSLCLAVRSTATECIPACNPQACQVCEAGVCVYACDTEQCFSCADSQCQTTCSGCESCSNGSCEDDDANCDTCQACDNGACRNITIECVTASASTVDLCDEVTFTVATDPGGYTANVQWSGGGSPAEAQGGTFTTKWPCIGNKTVTASICDSNDSNSVTVELPDGCGAGVNLGSSMTWYDYENLEYEGYVGGVFGRFGYFWAIEASLEYDVEFRYDNCTWVPDISCVSMETSIDVSEPGSGTPPVTENSVDSADTIWCQDINDVIENLTDTDLADDVGPPLGQYWSHSAMVCHERKHRTDWHDYYEERLEKAIDYCETAGDPNDWVDLHIEIDCANENTHSCQDVLSCYGDVVDGVLAGVYGQTYSLMDDPDTSLIECEVSAWQAHADQINPILEDLQQEVCN